MTFHTDAGHGWLETQTAVLAIAGLTTNDFSQYSYVSHDGTMFLEEDYDALKLMRAVEGRA